MCAGQREPAGETCVFRAAQQAAEQTTPERGTAGGDQVKYSG